MAEPTPAHGRLPIAVGWAIAFVAFTVLALAFDANGDPYRGWSRGFGIASFATVAAAISSLVFRPRVTRFRSAIACGSLVVAAAALAVTIARYGDATGSSSWADALAWIGCAALLTSLGALALPESRSRGERRR